MRGEGLILSALVMVYLVLGCLSVPDKLDECYWY